MTRTERNFKAVTVAVSDFKEKDKTVRALTDCGLKTFVLKGVKSDKAKLKFAASLFSTVEFFAVGDGMFTVSGASPVDMRYGITDDIKKYAAASVVSEAVSKCCEEDGDTAAEFALLDFALSAIDAAETNPLSVVVWTLVKLLAVEGVDFEDYTVGRGVKTLFRALRDADFSDLEALDFEKADYLNAANFAERLLGHALGVKLRSLAAAEGVL